MVQFLHINISPSNSCDITRAAYEDEPLIYFVAYKPGMKSSFKWNACLLLFHVFSFLPKHLNHLWKYCFRTVHVMDNSRVQLIQKGHGTGNVSFLVSSSWVGSMLFKCTYFLAFILHLLFLVWSWHLYVFSDAVFRDLEHPLFLHPCPPAVILVCTLPIFLFDTICCSLIVWH